MYAAYRCGPSVAAPVYRPRYDVSETPSGFEVTVDLPGVAPEDLEVKLEDGRLTLQATRWLGPPPAEGQTQTRPSRVLRQSFVVPDSVDPNKVTAKLDKGVLTLGLSKREEATPRSLKIEVH